MIAQALPHNIEIEKAVVGCLIFSKDVRHKITQITEDHFYSDTNKIIFKIVKWMHELDKTIDVVTVSDYCSKKDISLEYVIELTQNWFAESFNDYLEKLHEYKDRRYYIQAGQRIIEESYNSEFISRGELKNAMLSKISVDVETNNLDQYMIENIIAETVEHIENVFNNTNQNQKLYGYKDLDRATGGIHKGEMIVIAARPSVGKTSFALQLMLKIASKGNRCIFFTKEMPKRNIVQRLITNVTGLDSNKMRFANGLDDEDWPKIRKASCQLREMDIIVNDKCNYIEEIESFCIEQHAKKPIDLIIIDYVGLYSTMQRFQTTENEISIVSGKAKNLSIKLDTTLMLLSQLNRDCVKNNRPPDMHDLRSSGSIEQDADVIGFLHRVSDKEEKKPTEDVDFIISKQREGPLMTIPFKAGRPNGRWFGVNY